MGAIKTEVSVTRTTALEAFSAEGCSEPRFWGNGPGDTYGRHSHGSHKVLFCLEGSIVFHTDEGDALLAKVRALPIDPGSVWLRGGTLEDVFLSLTGRRLIE